MKKPTQKEIKKFFENASEEDLCNLMEYAKCKETRDIAIESYDWKNAGEYNLRNLMEYAEDKEVRDMAIEHYDWKNASEEDLCNLMKYAKDKETRDMAEKHLPASSIMSSTDVYNYLIGKTN